jgi:hypothetical protein
VWAGILNEGPPLPKKNIGSTEPRRIWDRMMDLHGALDGLSFSKGTAIEARQSMHSANWGGVKKEAWDAD